MAIDDKYLQQDVLLTTLSPYIQNALTGYYGELTQYALNNTEIIELKRNNGDHYRFFWFTVVVKVKPFTGTHTHTPIGIDNITLKVNGHGIKVTNFSHKDI